MRLLTVGTLDGHMTTAAQIAMKRGAKVAMTDSIEDALNNLRLGQGADLIMMDVRMNIGLLVQHLDKERIHVPVVACGLDGTDAATAAGAISQGAQEYIPLPPDPELIAAVLEAAVQEDNAIIHRDPAMKQVIQLADQIAPSDASVLVTGESGTGKEVMARYLHNKSRRAAGPFVAVNCAAIPENLLESELFGHEKGAFSGAVAKRIGKFEEANGGTLLLDEISEMDLRLQAKLLRAIQEREIDRVGGSKPVKIDARILATSNRFMETYIQEGKFREDLYFRLNVVNIQLPALRERPLDISILCQYFLKKYSDLNAVEERPITPEAINKLVAHHWKGNVRELENTMHRAVLLAIGPEINEDAIMLTGARPTPPPQVPIAQAPIPTPVATPYAPPPSSSPIPPISPMPVSIPPAPSSIVEPAPPLAAVNSLEDEGPFIARTVADMERQLIIETLDHYLGNRTHAANVLGISIRTLRNKLKQYSEDGIEVPEANA